MFESFIPEKSNDELFTSDKVKILIVGVGGGGCNTVTRIMKFGIKSATTVAINTDANHLRITDAHKKILIGETITRGLGAGGYPEVAAKCAEASKDKIREALEGANLVFLCAGMGGGTGGGASPIVGKIAKEEGAIVVAVVTTPFSLERARIEKAMWCLRELQKSVDTVVVIDNNRLVQFVPNLPMNEAFKLADEIVAKAVRGISDTIVLPSLINIDFADVKTIMSNGGVAMLSVGEGKGPDKVNQVIRSALEHPLLDVSYEGAKGALIHIDGGSNLTLSEATRIGEGITNYLDPNANVIWGARLGEEQDAVRVTTILTGVKYAQLEGIKEEEKEIELDIAYI
ncbi:MAG: cell division protein FtsZ [Candidatus Micrarchaeia archaeon]